MEYFRIVNWHEFQHYKDRNPPWVKLHREIINSRTWVVSDDASRVLAIACMVIASATDNVIPLDPSFFTRRAYLNSEPDFQPLFDSEFIELCDRDGNMLADASTSASSSVSVSTSVSKDISKKNSNKRAKRKSSIPDDFSISDRVKTWAAEKGHHSLTAHLENFIGQCEAKGYTYTDWDAAFMNAIRKDWAGLNDKTATGGISQNTRNKEYEDDPGLRL